MGAYYFKVMPFSILQQQITLFLALNQQQIRIRHIDNDYHFIKELVDQRTFKKKDSHHSIYPFKRLTNGFS